MTYRKYINLVHYLNGIKIYLLAIVAIFSGGCGGNSNSVPVLTPQQTQIQYQTSIPAPTPTPVPPPVPAPAPGGSGGYQSIDTPTKIFFTASRISRMKAIRDADHTVWQYLLSRLAKYQNTDPYNYGEYSSAYALAYRLTGNTQYLTRAKYLLDKYATFGYKNRNGFRNDNRWAHFTFDWIRDQLTTAEKQKYAGWFKTWGQYWENYVNYNNNFSGFRTADSDETTSLTESFLLIGLSLEGIDDTYAQTMLNVSDAMLSQFIVGQYMNGHMAGGMWGEGSDYSPATVQHWIRQFLINKEYRNIQYPTAYISDTIKAIVHSTYPGYTGMFEYGDLEAYPDDYTLPTHEYRDSMMLALIAAEDNTATKALGQYWLYRARAYDGGPQLTSSYTGIWRMLFEQIYNAQSSDPVAAGLPTNLYAPGIEFVSMRDNWSDSGTAVYFQNSISRVDHYQRDALSFNIISDGVAITKELTGYSGYSGTSYAHNTLLIENADGGNSSPTLRPAGPTTISDIDFDTSFSYVSADAANAYNMSGYYAENYTDYVKRKLFYLKPDIVVVYDYIQINPNYSPRKKTYTQRFQARPTLSNGVYTATSQGKTFHFKTLLPVNHVANVIDESQLLSGAAITGAPVNQRKWKIMLNPVVDQNKMEFLNILYFNNQGAGVMPATSSLFTQNGEMTGTYISKPARDYIVLFNNDPTDTAPTGALMYSFNTTKTSDHFLTGLTPGGNYGVTVTKSGSTLTVTLGSGSNAIVNAKGTLKFTLNSNGVVQ